ncbi:DUF1876 domain-containing protein [Williamsia sp. 1135]|uniref:DUF1876 domain-containing protein n=1 Tax=Williamsia sp. 1135 TaxID=1889262 RepID=UPI000A11F0FF|nr:DUF1876 domain-containing protein [Williamsia sp. 1135]ORM36805.1 hypothetical protein BFL43_06230 [Williamsia sp. 1135]
MEEHRWNVEIYVDSGADSGTKTVARALLHARDDTDLVGIGFARRNPHDADVPEIGDELAASRSLSDLADQLLRASVADVADITHDHGVLNR